LQGAQLERDSVRDQRQGKLARRRDCPLLVPPAELLGWSSSGARNGVPIKPIQDALRRHQLEFYGTAMPIDMSHATTKLTESRKPIGARTGMDPTEAACG
jgi:hypothetical protein